MQAGMMAPASGIVSIFKTSRQFVPTLENTSVAFHALPIAEPSDVWLEDEFPDDT